MKHLTMIMEITTKGMTATKISFNNLITPIYFTIHLERQLLDLLKKYPYEKMNLNF